MPLDVFSWVILWKPIDKLIFAWNPYLKEISIYHRLVIAETILNEPETETSAVVEFHEKICSDTKFVRKIVFGKSGFLFPAGPDVLREPTLPPFPLLLHFFRAQRCL